jgi:hypothetical protein
VARETFDLSTPVGLEATGINKVLCMKSGFTVLFHFENGKSITVQVFDTLHKRVSNTTVSPDMLDVKKLSTALFKGMHEIGGEAVLFFEQQNTGKHTLIRMRFNGLTGKLVDESRIGKSPGLARPEKFYVMKHKREEGYSVLYCQDAPQFTESKLHVSYFNARHEIYRDIPLKVDRKKYDYLMVIGAESAPEGVCVALAMSNLLVGGTGTTVESAPVYDHSLQVFYLPRDSSAPIERTIKLSTDCAPYYTMFANNPFAGTINLLLLNYRDARYRFGIEMRPTAFLSNLLFRFDRETLAGEYNWLTNKLANKQLADQTDTTHVFKGFPVRMFTNSNGLSTVISESYSRDVEAESFSGSRTRQSFAGSPAITQFDDADSYPRSKVFETYFGNICITQFDDNGKELWGTVLPKSQFYKSYKHYYQPADISRKWQEQGMFDDLPPQIFERQFLSSNIYSSKDNFFIVFNDGSRNFNNTIANPGDTVYNSELSNAVYYKVNRKKEITKHYLLGEPLVKEYKSSCIEGADFDEQRGIYATLVRYKRGEYVTMRMAWVNME